MKVYINQNLKDKKASLSNDLHKVKAIYAPFQDWNEATAELEEAINGLEPLATAQDDQTTFFGLFEDKNSNIVAVSQLYKNDQDNQDDKIVLVVIAEVSRGQKVYLPDELFGFVESVLTIKDVDGLSLNGWNEINGGMLEYRSIQPRKSLKDRMGGNK